MNELLLTHTFPEAKPFKCILMHQHIHVCSELPLCPIYDLTGPLNPFQNKLKLLALSDALKLIWPN